MFLCLDNLFVCEADLEILMLFICLLHMLKQVTE